MPFRPYFFGFFAIVAVLLSGGTFASAQPTTDFSSWKDAKNADAIPDRVQRMLLRDFRDFTGTDREELLAKTLSELADIALDSDVVPSTRYNAVLAVGQLESSSGSPPVAYPAALTVLVDVYQKTDSPAYMKYGALLGIVRHALCGIDPARQDEVINLLLKTVTGEFDAGVAEPLEPAVEDWFRLTALDGLAALKTTGPNGNIVEGLLAVIDQKSQELENLSRLDEILTRENWKQSCRSIELASKAAKTLGDFDYQSATDIDAKKMTDTFIRLPQSVCNVQRKMAVIPTGREETSPAPAMLIEQIVHNVKFCTQSVIWGIRSGLLTSKPGENSFYASLEDDDPAVKRLDILLTEVIELTTFFDEGEKSRRTVAAANAPKEFKFNLSELRDALAKCAETIAKEGD